MASLTTHYGMNKKTGKQFVVVCLLILPLVLFSLCAFTYTPNTPQSVTTGKTLLQAIQVSTTLPLNMADVSCSDVITLEQLSWSGISIYFNACALEHLTAIVAGASAVGAAIGALGLVSLVCPECDPLLPWLTALVSGTTAGIYSLQYASQNCGGAILDISWDGGIQFESACTPPDNGS